jgi:hypothetical protein
MANQELLNFGMVGLEWITCGPFLLLRYMGNRIIDEVLPHKDTMFEILQKTRWFALLDMWYLIIRII